MRAGAVVAAAGLSRRMRREKTLLPLGTSTVLQTVLSCLAAARVRDVAVVIRPDLAAARTLAEGAGARVVENPHPEGDLLSSIRLGAAALDPSLDAFFVWPADHPLVRTETLDALLAAGSSALAVIPTWRARRGHPALVGAALKPDIASRPLPGGLRDLWRERSDAVRELAVEDEGVVLDLNTSEEYEEALRRLRRRTEDSGRRTQD